MDDNTELIKLLNDFLVGIDMGTDTFRSYEEKLESEDLKNEFKKILSTFASQKEIVVSQINKLGGEVDESLDIGQEIGSLFSKLKDALITDDEEVLKNAVKAMDMGVKQGNKVIGKIEASDANRTIIETLNHMVNEYREISLFLMTSTIIQPPVSLYLLNPQDRKQHSKRQHFLLQQTLYIGMAYQHNLLLQNTL